MPLIHKLIQKTVDEMSSLITELQQQQQQQQQASWHQGLE